MVVGSTVHVRAFSSAPNVKSSLHRGNRRCILASAQTVAESASKFSDAAEKKKNGEEKIYVGRGRYVVDDPAKYPDRTPLTGGFAGGEVKTIL